MQDTQRNNTVGSALVALSLHPKAELLKQLQDTIPTNEYGLPEYLYRADLINAEASHDTATQDFAIMQLDYSQGFAALPDGDAVWERLPYEDPMSYQAFKHYVEMPRTTDERFSAPVRQLSILKPLTGKTANELLSLSYMYYWPARARAYDLFVIASHTKSKELRVNKVENEHYTRAQKYIEYAENFLEGVFQNPEDHELTPKEAFDMMFKMMQAQRLSVGLSPNGAHANKDVNQVPQNASLEVILRTIAKNAGISGADNKEATNLTQELFKDPKSLEQAQELIIRMSNARNPRTQKQADFMDGE